MVNLWVWAGTVLKMQHLGLEYQELSILELPDWFTLGSISIAFWFSVIPTIIFSVEFSVNNPNQQELIVELGEILISKK